MDKLEGLSNLRKKLESLVRKLREKTQLKHVSCSDEDNEDCEDCEDYEDSEGNKIFKSLGDYDHSVVHLDDSPVDLASKQRRADIERLKEDNERLRARLSFLDSYNGADLTYQIDDAIKSRDEIRILTQKVQELEARENKLLGKFEESNREYREVCYLATGYRIEPLNEYVYKLTHKYDDQEGHSLYFEINKDGTVSLLENAYLNEHKELIANYLEEAESFPAFLAAITLKLFGESNQLDSSIDMSMTMCTTVIENN